MSKSIQFILPVLLACTLPLHARPAPPPAAVQISLRCERIADPSRARAIRDLVREYNAGLPVRRLDLRWPCHLSGTERAHALAKLRRRIERASEDVTVPLLSLDFNGLGRDPRGGHEYTDFGFAPELERVLAPLTKRTAPDARLLFLTDHALADAPGGADRRAGRLMDFFRIDDGSVFALDDQLLVRPRIGWHRFSGDRLAGSAAMGFDYVVFSNPAFTWGIAGYSTLYGVVFSIGQSYLRAALGYGPRPKRGMFEFKLDTSVTSALGTLLAATPRIIPAKLSRASAWSFVNATAAMFVVSSAWAFWKDDEKARRDLARGFGNRGRLYERRRGKIHARDARIGSDDDVIFTCEGALAG